MIQQLFLTASFADSQLCRGKNFSEVCKDWLFLYFTYVVHILSYVVLREALNSPSIVSMSLYGP